MSTSEKDSAPYTRPHVSGVNPRYLALGLAVHLMWGVFPIYFHFLNPAGSVEIIVHRALWGFVSCIIALVAMGALKNIRAIFADRDLFLRLTAAGFLVLINWTTYIYAVLTDRTVDAALGYFINPLLTVALGLIVLREHITTMQKVALGLGTLAVAVLVVGMGRLPWISLTLALSFGLYSLVKKTVATRVAPMEGMLVETAVVLPVLLAYFGYLAATSSTSFHTLAASAEPHMHWGAHLALLMGSGVLTVIPLVLFAKAAQGLPLGILGFIQYVSPTIQLLLGVFLFHEQVEPMRWTAMSIIWCALVCLTVDGMVQMRRRTRLLREA